MIDASWINEGVMSFGGGPSGRATPHVLGPSSAYDTASAYIPPKLVASRKLRVEYTKMFGYGGSTYEVIDETGKEHNVIARFDSLAAAKNSEFSDIFRGVYSVYKLVKSRKRG